MADIFISYANEDRTTAQRLAQALESEGWTVWWDHRLRGGVEYRPAIEAELKVTGCVVVLWSAHSVASTFVCDEAQIGQRRGVLVPVVIEAGVEGALGFRGLHTLSLVGWVGDREAAGFRRLTSDLEALLPAPKPKRKARGAAVRPPLPVAPAGNPAAPPPHAPAPPPPDAGWPRWGVALLAAGAAIGGALIWGSGSGGSGGSGGSDGDGDKKPAATQAVATATPATKAAAPRGVALDIAAPAARPPSAQATLTGLFQFDKATLDFGPIAARADVTALPLSITLSQRGGPARLVKLVGSGADLAAFNIESVACPEAAGGWRIETQCAFIARFRPQHEGPHSARFDVAADGRPTGLAVHLGGNGAAPNSVGLSGLGNTVALDAVRCENGSVTLGGRVGGAPGHYLEVEPASPGARPHCTAWTGTHQRHAFSATCMRLPGDPERSAWTISSRPWVMKSAAMKAQAWLRRAVPGQNAVQTLAHAEAPLDCKP